MATFACHRAPDMPMSEWLSSCCRMVMARYLLGLELVPPTGEMQAMAPPCGAAANASARQSEAVLKKSPAVLQNIRNTGEAAPLVTRTASESRSSFSLASCPWEPWPKYHA